MYQKHGELTSREFTDSTRPCPGQYKFLWTDELDELAKERTSAYRAAKVLNTTEALAEYTQKSSAVKRLVACGRRNAFRSFCDELQKTQLAQSQVMIKRIVKEKQVYVIQHQAQGKTMNFRKYTLSPDEDSRAPRPIPWSNRTFIPAINLQNKIEEAIAPGPDLVIAEATKTAH